MNENEVQLTCFEIHGEKFAFNMEYLVEIVQIRQSEITPYFSPIPIIRGQWDHRGTSVYIIDVRDFFGLHAYGSERETSAASKREAKQESTEKNILVVRIREHIFGLLTDAVSQMQTLSVLYEYPTMISTLPRRYFAGVTIIKNELVLLLAIEKFINSYELDILLGRASEADENASLIR